LTLDIERGTPVKKDTVAVLQTQDENVPQRTLHPSMTLMLPRAFRLRLIERHTRLAHWAVLDRKLNVGNLLPCLLTTKRSHCETLKGHLVIYGKIILGLFSS
jgi:hypothetical protein